MTSTDLRLASTLGIDTSEHVSWTIDCPAPGTLIIDVAVGHAASAVPLHWRAGDWTKPPLDFRLSERGALESVQVVLQDEEVSEDEGAALPATVRGCPVFHVGDWPEGRYMDVRTSVKILRLPSGELHAVIGDRMPEQSIVVAEGLRLEVDTARRLVGAVIGPLSVSEWRKVQLASPGA